ncbi:hypothetical protein K437DRAFT_46432 [Tilletiaria anomala UBC 951]|uniref:Uncharacterized protein n=1 Tax=Tilletiaria anomala (strain ATCC 24038 / CBS 436.72 / UBC 951) TaxID=1037660 RepID=A0A066WHN2_TILAU|nr:uncharacterized protein K437DRAFT_46432 [Tilletiaria anomala UBC 951]KDN52028.1 hypothetical protein K437DRAFT_46432 [Tilletiaria anomala UBC 951]
MSGLFARLASASLLTLASAVGNSNEDALYSFDDDWNPALAQGDGGGEGEGNETDDAASVFSFTPTLVDRSGVLPYGQAGLLATVTRPLPNDKLFASFVANYGTYTPNASSFVRVGFPAQVKRGQNKSLRTRLRKGIIVQFPLRILTEIGYHANPRILTDITARRRLHQANRNVQGIGTVWSFELIDLVGIRERELMGIVLASLLKTEDVENQHLVYPPEMIVRAPSKLMRQDGSALIEVRWATLRLLSPAKVPNKEGPQLSNDGSGKPNADGSSNPATGISFGPTTGTDEQLLARLFEPSEEAELLLDRVLDHLERRGGIWTHAGHFTAQSYKNVDPRNRPEFTVHGLFPLPLLQRMKKYRSNKNQPMPSDLQLPPNDRISPLILHTISERLGTGAPTGPVSAVGSAPMQPETMGTGNEVDVLEGFTVGVTYEPYRQPRGTWGNEALAMSSIVI